MAINTTSIQARELLQQDYSRELAVKNAMESAPSAGATATPAAAGAAAVQPAGNAAAGAQGPNAATAQAASGQVQTTPAAQTAQQQANQQAQETFNAPVLRLPARPTTHAVLRGLAGAMAAPETNQATAARLKEFHDQVFAAEQTMIQAIVDVIRG